MNTKQSLTVVAVIAVLFVLAAAAFIVPPLGGTKTSLLSTEYSVLGTGAADVTLAAQKARLALSDGRTATFAFVTTAGTLTAHAAVGLDQECNFALVPLADPPLPGPEPTPQPAP